MQKPPALIYFFLTFIHFVLVKSSSLSYEDTSREKTILFFWFKKLWTMFWKQLARAEPRHRTPHPALTFLCGRFNPWNSRIACWTSLQFPPHSSAPHPHQLHTPTNTSAAIPVPVPEPGVPLLPF